MTIQGESSKSKMTRDVAKCLLYTQVTTEADQLVELCRHLKHAYSSQSIHCHKLAATHHDLTITNIRLYQEQQNLRRQFANEDLLVAFYQQAFQSLRGSLFKVLRICESVPNSRYEEIDVCIQISGKFVVV